MLLKASLQPSQAVTALNERVKRIGKVNTEIADWLAVLSLLNGVDLNVDNSQERRKVEEAYIQGLKKLSHKQPPDSQSELGYYFLCPF